MQVRSKTSPSGDGKQLHTYFIVRRRYKRARWMAAGAGALLAALGIAMALSKLETIGYDLDTGFYAEAITLLLAAAAVPWLIVEGLWRRARWRHFWDWQ